MGAHRQHHGRQQGEQNTKPGSSTQDRESKPETLHLPYPFRAGALFGHRFSKGNGDFGREAALAMQLQCEHKCGVRRRAHGRGGGSRERVGHAVILAAAFVFR